MGLNNVLLAQGSAERSADRAKPLIPKMALAAQNVLKLGKPSFENTNTLG